jgi:hypothetical protein
MVAVVMMSHCLEKANFAKSFILQNKFTNDYPVIGFLVGL